MLLYVSNAKVFKHCVLLVLFFFFFSVLQVNVLRSIFFKEFRNFQNKIAKIFWKLYLTQWNLYLAETTGTKKFVH